MKVTFLGTGTSQGVPVIACDCQVCKSESAKDKRLRVSILIENSGKNIVVDSGPDFRYQMLRAEVKHLEAILFTHEHKDHVAGLDDIRAFNFRQKQAMDIFGHKRVLEHLKQEFHYAFTEFKYPGVPLINLHQIENSPFQICDLLFTPIEVMHYKLPVFGFRIENFTYITDAKTVSETEKEKIRGTETLVINALQIEEHISHFTLSEAIQFAEDIGAKTTYFTHISHRLGKHQSINELLPAGIELAYDGLVLNL